jgi:hypothetical protein
MTITLEVPRPRQRDGNCRAARDRSPGETAGHAAGSGGESTEAVRRDTFRPVTERGAA